MSAELQWRDNPCWCGASDLRSFSSTYSRCDACQTLVTRYPYDPTKFHVADDSEDFYGRQYWFSHQETDLAQPGILSRIRTDLPERVVHWLRAILRYKQPPGRVLELGSAHGGLVALLRWAGFDASGLELSPWVVGFARQTFDVPMYHGTIEQQQIAPGSLDAIVLMDVLEHLPNPVGTLQHAAKLLQPDGILVIQTPRYQPATTHQTMVERDDPFLVQLKTNEHLFLFSDRSVEQLLRRIGMEHLQFERAIFGHYDMFVVASARPLVTAGSEAIWNALSRTPGGRLVQALLDLAEQRDGAEQRYAELVPLRADVEYLKNQIMVSEADRAARLEVIVRQGISNDQLEAQRADLAAQLTAARAEITRLTEHIAFAEADESEARALLERARRGSVLRLARVLRPHGVDAAIARAITILEGSHEARGAAPQAAGSEPPIASSTEAPAAAPVADSLYAQIRDPKTTEPFHYAEPILDSIARDLSAQHFRVEELTIDPAQYRRYFQAAGYVERYPEYYSFNLPEKSLEHFLASQLLRLGPDDIYIDIASEHSPVPEIYSRLFGCVSYRQDLAYSEGLHGDRIGGDAAAMPVPDGFATKMALHCSFEHFEGDADERFVREIKRVLRPGGSVCIAPLYLWHRFAVLTDPAVAVAEQVSFDPEATVVCRSGWENRHGRLYDAAHLDLRIRRHLDGLDLTIYRVVNATSVDPSCYIQFAAVITKPAG